MLKKIDVRDAVGTKLTHDITRIIPGEFKGPAFRKGHTVCDGDICALQKLGKNHLYVMDVESDEIHENDAAVLLANALAGPGIAWQNAPKEGKITLHAAIDGMLFVDTATLAAFNMVDEVMCATRHTHSLVRKGDMVAAARPIPLVMKKAPVDRAAAIAGENGGVVSVKALKNAKVGVLITGSEVFEGLIEDRFAPILSDKIQALGSSVADISFAPDDVDIITATIRKHIDNGCDLILVSGGMSVDPDDVTRNGIENSGVDRLFYGASALPGAMFLVAYIGNVPLLGVPACGLFHKATVLDLILPRLLAGEVVEKKELAFLGHGGLCMDCLTCEFPRCPFGKGS